MKGVSGKYFFSYFFMKTSDSVVGTHKKSPTTNVIVRKRSASEMPYPELCLMPYVCSKGSDHNDNDDLMFYIPFNII